MNRQPRSAGRSVRRLLLLMVGMLTAVLLVTPDAAAGDGRSSPIYVDPAGNTTLYQRLAVQWWQWAIGTPVTPGGPFSDTRRPIDCTLNQRTSDVLFLAAPFNSSGSVRRICSAPITRGTKVFLPVINVECSDLEAPPFYGGTTGERQDCVQNDIFDFSKVRARVDGRPLPVADRRFTILTEDFQIHPVAGNPAQVPATGDGWSASRGVWVLLNPLSPGRHCIWFTGTISSFPFTATATYTLTVV